MSRRPSWRSINASDEQVTHAYLYCGRPQQEDSLMLCLDTPWVVVPNTGTWGRPKKRLPRCQLCEAILALRKVHLRKGKK